MNLFYDLLPKSWFHGIFAEEYREWWYNAITSKMCKFRKKIPWYQLFFTIVFTLHKFDKELVRVCRAAPLSFFFITFFHNKWYNFFFLICRHICVSYLKVSAQLIGEKKKANVTKPRTTGIVNRKLEHEFWQSWNSKFLTSRGEWKSKRAVVFCSAIHVTIFFFL